MPLSTTRRDNKPPPHRALHDPLGQRSREEAAVGKHAAADGDARHPVVAAALARRAVELAGAHRGDTQRIQGNLGWPGEAPAGGGGLGWPGDLPPAAPAVPPAGEADRFDVADEDQPEEPADGREYGREHPREQDGRRRGWRRLLGFDRAA
jgi:hypothetical protein